MNDLIAIPVFATAARVTALGRDAKANFTAHCPTDREHEYEYAAPQSRTGTVIKSKQNQQKANKIFFVVAARLCRALQTVNNHCELSCEAFMKEVVCKRYRD